MSNMSYCRFENTYHDLLDCSEHVFDKDLSEDEMRYKEYLIDLCKDIASDFQDYEDDQDA